MKRMHFSVDDFFDVLIDADQYDNLWDQPVFAKMKALHERYGATFSCYCFYEVGDQTLEDISDYHWHEFTMNQDWLKFGFHGKNKDTAYGPSKFPAEHVHDTYEQAGEDYKDVIDQLRTIMSEDCIDHVPRVHFYAGSWDACRAWRDAYCGIKGLLSAEDDRISYYLMPIEAQILGMQDRLHDTRLNLKFHRTKRRLENTPDILSAVKDETCEELIIFTHEVYLSKESIWQQFEDCCKYAEENGIPFGFPQEWEEE